MAGLYYMIIFIFLSTGLYAGVCITANVVKSGKNFMYEPRKKTNDSAKLTKEKTYEPKTAGVPLTPEMNPASLSETIDNANKTQAELDCYLRDIDFREHLRTTRKGLDDSYCILKDPAPANK